MPMSKAMTRLKDIAIRTRIAITVMLPVLGMLAMAGVFLAEKRRVAAEADQLVELVALANRLSPLVHEMQKERAVSAVYQGSQGKQMAEALPQQRQLTDKYRQELKAFLPGFDAARHGAGLAAELDRTLSMVGELDGKREQISKLAITPAEGVAYFTATNMQAVKTMALIGLASKDAATANGLAAYKDFVFAKEKTGQERAIGAASIAAGKFASEEYGKFVQATAQQATYLDGFMTTAPEELRKFYVQTVVGPAVDEAAAIRGIVLAGGLSGELKGTQGPHWVEVMTAKIDLMRKVEDRIARYLEDMARDEAAEAGRLLLATLAAIVLALGMTVALTVLLVRGITRPVSRLTQAMTDLAGGNVAVEIGFADRRNEIGAMARAIEVFKESLIRADRLAAEQREAQTARERRAARLEELTHRFNESIGAVVTALSEASAETERQAQTMAASAEQTSRQSASVSGAAGQTSSNVEVVATAAEELAASVSEINRQVTDGTSVSREAVSEAEATNAKVVGLAEAAQRIGDIGNLIKGIASQTNLLALNATIEAARAGEAGRGFAVVASEVKALARQTAEATEEIAAQIAAIRAATEQSVGAITSIGATITRSSEIAGAIAAAVNEQEATVNEIARSVQEAARGTQEVSQNIGEVTRAAARTGDAAREVLEASRGLAEQAGRLRQDVDGFLAEIRAA
jgi:methyl-accepting chemotaxis protein